MTERDLILEGWHLWSVPTICIRSPNERLEWSREHKQEVPIDPKRWGAPTSDWATA